MVSGSCSRVVALAVVLLLSGCTFGVGPGDPVAPTSDSDAVTDGATGGEGVPLEEHSLSLEKTRTFERVERLVDEDVQPPPVRVIERPTGGGVAGGFTYTPYRFAQYLDLDNVSADGGPSAAGLTDGLGQVYIVPNDGATPVLEQVLVHEFVHVVQFRSDMMPANWPQGGNDTTDAAQTRLALVEGSAVYVTDTYTERYLGDANVSLQSDQMARSYEQARVGGRFVFARYHFGSTYVADRLDSPDQLRSLFEDPPETTEQILQGDDARGDPYQPLSVEASGGEWGLAEPDDVDIMGELFVRVALSRALSLEEAGAAADGWGNDRVVEYERGDDAGFAWVLRWDDAANVTEFRDAMETYTDRRPTGPGLAFETTTVDEETVVVFVGPPAFVDAASASGTNEDVRVRVE